ncbi:MAG: DNA gyrase inhibitor YacG [Desulfuromonas sp.]|nr:MAG: DNA gyrase inhibitor YacG [Desulfuromonas sp.]
MQVPCPKCRKSVDWQGNPHRPFCSERCRQLDLGSWADESYRVAGESVDPEALEKIIPFPGADGLAKD